MVKLENYRSDEDSSSENCKSKCKTPKNQNQTADMATNVEY